MPRRRLQICCGRCSVSGTSLTTMQQRCEYWGSGSASMSRCLAFRDGVESSSVSPTRREIAFSVIPSAMMATPSLSTSAMGTLPLSPQSSRTPTYHLQPSVLFGLLFVFQMFGCNLYGQPFQLPEVVRGAEPSKVSCTRSCVNVQARPSTISEAA
jgi:hypothetical protein